MMKVYQFPIHADVLSVETCLACDGLHMQIYDDEGHHFGTIILSAPQAMQHIQNVYDKMQELSKRRNGAEGFLCN